MQNDDKKQDSVFESKIENSEQLILDHPSYKQLEEKLTKAEQQAQENWNKLLRAMAEIENVQRRAKLDISNAHKYSLEKFVMELLPVVDSLERSLLSKKDDHEKLKDFYDGIELTLKLFLEVLQKFHVEQINPLGQEFNHEYHNAISVREDSGTNPNTIMEVIQKGYLLKNRLLRPALVIVTK